MPSGGKRPGSGRKKKPKKPYVYIPAAMVEDVREFISQKKEMLKKTN